MIDIHTHLIPRVDDGSSSIEESLELIKCGIQQGVTHFFCTPHSEAFHYSMNVISNYDRLREAVHDNSIQAKLYLGAEIYCSINSIKEIIKNVNDRIYPTLNGTNYLLIEFNVYNPFIEDAVSCVRDITNVGLIPIIAHAERYAFSNHENIELLKAQGAMIQINAYSLFNEEKMDTKSTARDLMDNKLVDFIGSDTHRLNHRPVMVQDGIEFAYQKYEKNYVDKVMYENADKLLIGG